MEPFGLTKRPGIGRLRRVFATSLCLCSCVLAGRPYALAGPNRLPLAVDTTASPRLAVETIPLAYRAAVAGWAGKLGPYYRNLRRDKAHYLQFIRGLLTTAGLPEELSLIAVVESGFSAEATSVDGAAGVWQLMPEVALEAALSLSPVDQRRDVYKSSHAAVQLIRSLYRRYGDVLTVVAAYNCGPGRTEGAGAVRGERSRYWAIHPSLPPETQAHVLKFLAAVSVMLDHPLPPAPIVLRASPPDSAANAGLPVTALSASYREAAILAVLQLDSTAFRQLNPALDATLATQGTYEMRLSKADMLRFFNHKREILLRSMQSGRGPR